MKRTGSVDPRYQSYNIEMLEVMGGAFWKPYGAVPKSVSSPAPGRSIADPSNFEYRPPIDLTNPRLVTLARALGPAYLRVSGTWANTAYFSDSDTPPAQPPQGFKGVLSRQQWRRVVEFSRAVDARIITSFTVSPGVRDANGVWTADQASRWLSYTRSIGGNIAAAEFMNEPSMAGIGGTPKGYDAAAYGRDFKRFRTFAKSEAPDMIILGPGSATETPAPWGIPASLPGSITSDALLTAAGPGIDAFSYHHYGAASQRCAAAHMPQTSEADALSEQWLERASMTQAFYAELRDRYAPGKPIWMTEGADAACGGNPWAGSFVDSFRYLDQLGRLAKANVQVSAHNTLAASDYSLLDPRDLTPKANYWAALLWRRLMGSTVLDAGLPIREGLHVYAHCQAGRAGGVSMLVINNSTITASSIDVPTSSLRYTLSAPVASTRSANLNGKLLELGENGTLPSLVPAREERQSVVFTPKTISFLVFPNVHNPMCASS